ncbi:MAG: hypothetical protein H6619_05815 [Deltaproteobacteria bacterium]|nr:hypothetical protein [Deltaproteobacteria bacterium]
MESNFKISQPGAYLDQLIRQTRNHHVQLSLMADRKANMLLTMSSIVTTLAIPALLKPELKIAAMILIVCSIFTIVFAAYSTMPSPLTDKLPIDRSSPLFNILFFGHFRHLEYDEYLSEMETIMNDPSLTYEAQVKEVYSLGMFLANRKFKLLRFAYLTFIIGLVISGITLLIFHFM